MYVKARNRKGRIISKFLRRGFRCWIAEAIDQDIHGIWRVAKWARSRGNWAANTIPILNGLHSSAETTEAKAEVLREVFFSELFSADLSNIEQRFYSTQIDFPEITKEEVAKAIRRALPDKASGSDRIPNKVWYELLNVLIFLEKITTLFNVSVKTEYNFRYFQISIIVVLRKAALWDYRLSKSYRLVVLLNILEKILELIIATRIIWILEKHKLFPKIYLEGRKGISTDYTI